MAKNWLIFSKDDMHTGSTFVYDVIIGETGENIGTVQWVGDTYRYAYYPVAGFPLGRTSLREIADFIETLMDARKESRRNHKQDEATVQSQRAVAAVLTEQELSDILASAVIGTWDSETKIEAQQKFNDFLKWRNLPDATKSIR